MLEKEQVPLRSVIDDNHVDDSLSKSVVADVDEEKPNISGDRKNIALLCFLYLMQGIPLGLSVCIPVLLHKRNASYETQAKLSMAQWPFSVKLLWAPIVDSVYSKRFGRRKSWLVPVQYLIGILLLVSSYYIDQWLGDESHEANIGMMGTIFFAITALAATQDIAVDGWGLTLLKRRNVGYASICQSFGQPLGIFLGYSLLISLESAEFCNTWLRSEPKDVGILTLAGFYWLWGGILLFSTTLIALFKSERSEEEYDNELSIKDTYKLAFKIVNIPAIRLLAVVLLTVKVIWADYEGLGFLKFLDTGISMEKMIPMKALSWIPVQLVVTSVVAKYAAGSNPTRTYIYAMPCRTFFQLVAALIIYMTPKLIPANGIAPNYIYFVYLINNVFYNFCQASMEIVITILFIKISDPKIAGTYMTLLNTINDLGRTYPYTIAMWLVELLTWRDCKQLNSDESVQVNATKQIAELSTLVSLIKKCPIVIDGYFVETAFCLIFGLCWYKWGIRSLRRLQKEPMEAWRVQKVVPVRIPLEEKA